MDKHYLIKPPPIEVYEITGLKTYTINPIDKYGKKEKKNEII